MAVEGEEVEGVGEVADQANVATDVEDLVRAETVDVIDDNYEALVQPSSMVRNWHESPAWCDTRL